MNHLPGPRLGVSWLLWVWLIMFLALFFQVGGIVQTLAEIVPGPTLLSITVVVGSAIALLVWGRYRVIERVCTAMVCLFTLATVVGVALLQSSEKFAIGADDILGGLKFRLFEQANGEAIDFGTAFAAFGITGVGASELIYYPYWCLEKGYARFVGPNDGSEGWAERARGWITVLRVDAWLSFVVYTVATLAFYLLGAAVLHRQEVEVDDDDLVDTLARMYTDNFGEGALALFLIGAFFVLYSTFFAATASNSRLAADALGQFGVVRYRNEAHRRRVVQVACVVLPLIAGFLAATIGKPVTMVLVGGLAQAFMLPLLGAAALYLRFQRCDSRIAPGKLWTSLLWISFLAMAAIGVVNLLKTFKVIG